MLGKDRQQAPPSGAEPENTDGTSAERSLAEKISEVNHRKKDGGGKN